MTDHLSINFWGLQGTAEGQLAIVALVAIMFLILSVGPEAFRNKIGWFGSLIKKLRR